MKLEISRSFSRKLQVKQYEPAEFFASYKTECEEKDAEKISQELFELCRRDVEASAEKYLNELRGSQMNELSEHLEKSAKGKKAIKSEKENEQALEELRF